MQCNFLYILKIMLRGSLQSNKTIRMAHSSYFELTQQHYGRFHDGYGNSDGDQNCVSWFLLLVDYCQSEITEPKEGLDRRRHIHHKLSFYIITFIVKWKDLR